MSKNGKRELHEVSVKVLHITDKAYLVTEGLKDGEGKEIKHWMPKSQVQCDYDDDDMIMGKVYTFTLPRWLIEEKGLVVE